MTEPGWVDPRESRLLATGGEGLEVWVKEGMKLLKMEEEGRLSCEYSTTISILA